MPSLPALPFLALPDIPPVQLAILLGAICLAGFVRGYAGFGAGLLFMPTASAMVSPPLAVAAFFLIDELVTLPLIPNAVRKAYWPTVTPTVIAAIFTAPLGAYVLITIDPILMRWAISLLIFAMLALLISGWRYHGAPKLPISLGVGGVAGFLSGAAQIPGPPVVTYWMAGPLKSDVIRANLISFFFIVSLSTAIAFLLQGIFTPQSIGLAVLMAVPYGVFIWLGATRFSKAGETTFRRLAYALIAISAVTSLPFLDAWFGRN